MKSTLVMGGRFDDGLEYVAQYAHSATLSRAAMATIQGNVLISCVAIMVSSWRFVLAHLGPVWSRRSAVR